jgi:hypothetical protein
MPSLLNGWLLEQVKNQLALTVIANLYCLMFRDLVT